MVYLVFILSEFTPLASYLLNVYWNKNTDALIIMITEVAKIIGSLVGRHRAAFVCVRVVRGSQRACGRAPNLAPILWRWPACDSAVFFGHSLFLARERA